MGATIQNLFPLTLNKYEDFTVYPCAVAFSAPVVGGKYIFSRTTTPPQYFGKLLQTQIGIIAGISLSANCAEEDFTRAVNGTLELQILHGGNKTPVNAAPFPFANFSQTDNFQLEWISSGCDTKQQENFELSITGAVDQLPNMTSNELELKVVFNYIRVGSDKLIDGFKMRLRDDLGSDNLLNDFKRLLKD